MRPIKQSNNAEGNRHHETSSIGADGSLTHSETGGNLTGKVNGKTYPGEGSVAIFPYLSWNA